MSNELKNESLEARKRLYINVEYQDEPTPEPPPPEPKCPCTVPPLAVKVFAGFNAFVILLGFAPALLPFTWPFSLPTPWHFWQGYGTPLGLPFWPGLAFAVVCAAYLALCIRDLKRKTQPLLKSLVWRVVGVIFCVIGLMVASSSPHDYVRNSMLRDAPGGIPMEVRTNSSWAHIPRLIGNNLRGVRVVDVRVEVSTDAVCITQLEASITEIQQLAIETLQRRRARRYNIEVRLNQPGEGEVLSWFSGYMSARVHGHSVGEYGNLWIMNPELVAPNIGGGWSPSRFRFDLPVANIQQTMDTIVAINAFGEDLVHQAYYVGWAEVNYRAYIDEDRPRSSWGEAHGAKPGEVRVTISHSSESLPINLSDAQATFVQIGAHARSVAQSHGMEITSIRITLWPDDLNGFVVWWFWDDEEDGEISELSVWGTYRREFANVPLAGIYQVLTPELIEIILEEKQANPEFGGGHSGQN